VKNNLKSEQEPTPRCSMTNDFFVPSAANQPKGKIMTKRADKKFKQKKQNKYYTPWSATEVLLKHLPEGASYCEPCAGDGALFGPLLKAGHECKAAYDIDPDNAGIKQRDALTLEHKDLKRADYIITNPPWPVEIMHPMIDHFRIMAPTWILTKADWAFTVQKNKAKAGGFNKTPEILKYCHDIVAVGRVSWMGNGVGGFDNCAWFLFGNLPGERRFHAICE